MHTEQKTKQDELIATLTALVERAQPDLTSKSHPAEYMRRGQTTVAVRVSPELHAAFHRTCKDRGISMTRVLKTLMSNWITD